MSSRRVCCHGPEFADTRKLQETIPAPNQIEGISLDFVTDVSYLQQVMAWKNLIKNKCLYIISDAVFRIMHWKMVPAAQKYLFKTMG